VDWTSEKDCFQGILKELAFFYSPRLLHPETDTVPTSTPPADADDEAEWTQTKEGKEQRLWQLEHVLFPSFRKYTAWPAMGRDAVQVANLPDLFRIFERC
jgi:DNA mismatch repair protein MLH1